MYNAVTSWSDRSATTLAYDEVVANPPDQSKPGQPNLGIIVHGLLGTGRNWRTFARSLAKQAAAESGRQELLYVQVWKLPIICVKIQL